MPSSFPPGGAMEKKGSDIFPEKIRGDTKGVGWDGDTVRGH